MLTPRSKDNPFEFNRWAFSWEHVPAQAAVLDFGCNDGTTLSALRCKQPRLLVGVEVSREAVGKAHQANPDLDVRHIQQTIPLELPDQQFDCILLLDVLEHVYEQRELLCELRRLLVDGGQLIVTVPGQHLFSFMDVGNLKFRFPRLHRWFYVLRHGKAAYDSRYLANADGLIGDISAQKRWHEHFTRRRLSEILRACGFEPQVFDGTGFLERPLWALTLMLRWWPWVRRQCRRLQQFDARHFETANLFCLAKKA